MHRAMLRASSAVAITAIALTTGTWAASPAHAHAQDESSAFVLTVFPQDTTQVGFSNSWGNRRS